MGAAPTDFSYTARKDGTVAIAWRGKPVRTLTGARAARFAEQVSEATEDDRQLLMAKATGNFKRGNERR